MAALTTADKLAAQNALGLNTEPEVDIQDPAPAPAPNIGPTDQDIADRIEQPKTSFGSAAAASFRVDNSGYAIYENLTDPEFYYDSTFDSIQYMETEDIKTRMGALTLADTDEVSEIMGSAFNRDHADHLLDRLEGKQQDEITISQAGAKGLLARLGANVIDPVDLLVVAAAAPLGGAVKLTKLGRILSIASTAGVSNATIESIVATDNPFRDETDVIFAGLAGITLGGALGTFLSRADNLRMEKLANGVARDHLDSVGASRLVSPEGAPNASLAPRAEQKFDDIFDEDDVPDFAFNRVDKLLTNLRGKLFAGTAAVRQLSSRMLEGGFLKDKTKTRAFTAEGRADAIYRSAMSRMMNQTDPDVTAWAKARGISGPRQSLGVQAGAEFYTEVAQALRGIAGASSEAVRAASRIRPLLDEVYDLAEKAGVKGFEKEKLDNFFPRMYDGAKVNRAIHLYGEDGVSAWVSRAILNEADDMTQELAEKIAKGYTRTLRRSASTIDQNLSHGIPLEDMDRLRELLGDGPDVDGIIDAVEAFKARRAANAGKITHAKSRLRLDESFSAPITRLDGTVETLSMTDLTHNDARRVLSRYFQVLSGHIGLAREVGIKSRADFDTLKTAAIAKGEVIGIPPNQLEKEGLALEQAYKLLTGVSIEDDIASAGSQLSRVARDVNFTRIGGKFGVAQIAELGNIVGVAGVRAFLRHLPELQRLTRRAADGQLDNRVARQLEEWFGPGTDFETHPAIKAFDQYGEGYNLTTRTGRTLAAVDAPLQVAKRTASVASLMAPINARLEKMAGVMHVLDVTDAARGKGKLNAARWRGAGLDDTMQARVLTEMKHAEFDGGTLKDLHIDRWDVDVADNFSQALRRQASLTIQRNDLSDLPVAMLKSPVAKLIFQFKSFMIGSINKQLNRGIHYRDIETATSWMAGMFFAGIAYIGQVSIDQANDPEKRKELLTPEKIAATAFQRAGFAAILIPPAATVVSLFGYDKFFNQRTSGLASSILSMDSNPTSGLLKDIEGTLRLPLNLLSDDYRFSQADLRRMTRILPFHRVLAVKNALHLLEEQLPKTSRR